MVRYKIHYKRPTPVEDALRVILVPVIMALLAVGGCVASRLEAKESTWNSPRTAPIEAPVMPRPDARAEIQVTTAPAPSVGTGPPASSSTRPASTPRPPAVVALPLESRSSSPEASTRSLRHATSTAPSSTDSTSSQGSDLHQQQNSSARTDPLPESIQGCQRSAADCFATGGLDTLTNNLDGLAIDPVTGRFCFSFQEGCRR